MQRSLKLNTGPQYDFVTNNYRHSAYIGGVGAGKTFALVVRALQWVQQPRVPGLGAPWYCLMAKSVPNLKDFIYPTFYKVAELTGTKFKERKSQDDRYFEITSGPAAGSHIKLRSLDEPDRIRGLEVCGFGVDEGRNFADDYAYEVMVGRLRQGRHPDDEIDKQGIWVPGENYKRSGSVSSTPHGFDWMWERFHPESEDRKPDHHWFNAPTTSNSRNLPADYIADLIAQYGIDSPYYRQEVLGEFVGVISGAVFSKFDPKYHMAPLVYNPELPLYSFWDFGVGDKGVCIFAQVAWETVNRGTPADPRLVELPTLFILGGIEESDLSPKEWATRFYSWLDKHTGGRLPLASYGDPAGIQRQSSSGTSTLAALSQEGIFVRPAPRRPVDERIIIIQNLIEGNRLIMDSEWKRGTQAVRNYRWNVNHDGVLAARKPVHDKNSHICDALGYGALGVIGLGERRTYSQPEGAKRGTINFMLEQLQSDGGNIEMGGDNQTPRIDWHMDKPDPLVENWFD